MSEDPFERPPEKSPAVRVLIVIASVFLAATVALTFAQVVLRFVFSDPRAWVEEVGRYLFVWITFLGAAVAVAHDAHIRVDAFVQRLGPGGQRATDILRRLVDLVCLAFITWSGVLVVWRNRNSEFYTIEGAPQVVFYLAVPVGSVLMILFLLRGLRRPPGT